MTDVLGDVSALSSQVVPFTAVHIITGSSVAGHFDLASCPGLQHLLGPYAIVEITGPITVLAVNPVGASKAITVRVGVIPNNAPSNPTLATQVACIGGSLLCRDSVYNTTNEKFLSLNNGVTATLKPDVLIGKPPRVVYHCNVDGGSADTQTQLEISGTVKVQGIGYVQPWV